MIALVDLGVGAVLIGCGFMLVVIGMRLAKEFTKKDE